MARGSAELQAELDALAFASAEALDRLREADDESGVRALIERRERLLARLAVVKPMVDAAVIEAAERALALDAELLAALKARLMAAGHEIEQITRTRTSLARYGATPAASAVYVEKLS
jgi:hypothetical protein